MMRKISVKLALFFIALICISSILSFVVAVLFTDSIRTEVKMNQETIAASILELREKTNLSLDEILGIIASSSTMYEVRRLNDPQAAGVSDQELARLQNNEIVTLSRYRFHANATMIWVDSSYLQIRLQPDNTIFQIVASRVWFTTLGSIFIGAALILLLVKRVVRPVLEVTRATQEVAKGNFDIQLEQKSDDEIGQLTQNFNIMTKELKNIEVLRKDFVTNVSHEFKTPLASIGGFAKLLQKGNLTEQEKHEYIDIIAEETTRLANLSANILKLSKLENQDILAKKDRFSLDEQIRKTILLLEPAWSKKEIEFDLDLDSTDLVGDEEIMEQVWLNLLDNAIKFSPPHSTISLSLKNAPSGAIVKVTDQGPGMTEETQRRMFEKFYQGDKAHFHEGNGLGLPLVKRILDLSGGTIHAETVPGQGTVFTVELPQSG